MQDRRRLNSYQIKWRFLLTVVGVLLIAFFFGVSRNASDLEEMRIKEETLQSSLSQKEMEKIALQQKMDAVGSNSYIESHARTEYGYLKTGEIRFEVQNPEALDRYTEEEWKRLVDGNGEE